MTVLLFGARAFVTGVFQVVIVYTPEVYPTKVRGVSLGVMTSAARIGALATPFIAQVHWNSVHAVTTVAAINVEKTFQFPFPVHSGHHVR